MRQLFALAVVLLSATVAPLSAQSVVVSGQWAEVQPGARVRIQSPGIVAGRLVATVLARTTDSLTVASPSSAPIAVPMAKITSIEISRGKSHSLGAIRGVEWGAPIGAALGLATMTLLGCDGCGDIGYDRAGYVGLSTLSGVFYGSIIGAIVGRERWDAFDLPRRTSLGITTGGAALAVRVAF